MNTSILICCVYRHTSHTRVLCGAKLVFELFSHIYISTIEVELLNLNFENATRKKSEVKYVSLSKSLRHHEAPQCVPVETSASTSSQSIASSELAEEEAQLEALRRRTLPKPTKRSLPHSSVAASSAALAAEVQPAGGGGGRRAASRSAAW